MYLNLILGVKFWLRFLPMVATRKKEEKKIKWQKIHLAKKENN